MTRHVACVWFINVHKMQVQGLMGLFIVITSLLTNSLVMRGEKKQLCRQPSYSSHMSLSICTTGIYHSLSTNIFNYHSMHFFFLFIGREPTT